MPKLKKVFYNKGTSLHSDHSCERGEMSTLRNVSGMSQSPKLLLWVVQA